MPRSKEYEDKELANWDEYKKMLAAKFAAHFKVAPESITIVHEQDQALLVCCAGTIWRDPNYQDSPEDDKEFYDVSSLEPYDAGCPEFKFAWTDEEVLRFTNLRAEADAIFKSTCTPG
jgi:hypothetical protein